MIRRTLSIVILAFGINAGLVSAMAATPAALPSLSPIMEKVSPAVVNIAVDGSVEKSGNPLLDDPNFKRFFDDPLFKRFFGNPDQGEAPRQKIKSVGSGVIIDAKKGYIITNNHVIDNADNITITLTNRRQLKAEVIGTDPEADLAVLKVEPDGLADIPLGDSGALKVGDFVIAIGNPFGIGQTATLGIVSALGRTGLGIEGYEDFIQTDASINPGNSGGALITQDGKLVGINTAIISRSGGNVGIGFAIPIDMVRLIVDQLIEHGEVRRGQLGVFIQDLTSDIAEAMGMDGRDGAVIARVIPDSPADKAGIKAGDVVTALNGEPIVSSSQLRNTVGLMAPNEKIKLEIVRDGKKRTISTRLEARQTEEAQGETLSPQLAGASFSDIPPDHELYGKVEGVLVVNVKSGSKADEGGLNAGDIVVSANRQDVKAADELVKIIKDNKDKPLLLNIRRGQGALFLVIR